jgi:hypothetical protein
MGQGGLFMSHIFISYRKKDRAECMALTTRLRDEGFSVWWDDDLPPGDDYTQIIEEKLRSAAAVIVLWTKNSVRSKWVYFETELAHRMGKLVPLKLDKCELPVGLDKLQTYDYLPAQRNLDKAWEAIVRRIREAIESGQRHAPQGAVATLEDLTWAKLSGSRDTKDFKDYLRRYPNSAHEEDAAELLRSFGRKTAARQTLWWIFGLIMYAALWAPTLSMIKDYGFATALFWATLYFHYFAFFIIFGTMMVPIYCFSLAKALSYGFRSNSFLAKAACVLTLCVAPVVFCGAVTVIETGSGYAPWQFIDKIQMAPVNSYAPQLAEKRSLIQIFSQTKTLKPKSLWEQRNYDPTLKVDCLAMGTQANEADCSKAIHRLNAAMEPMLKDKRILSLTAATYSYSFFFFAMTFLGTYFNIFFLCFNSQKVRAWMAGLAPWGGQRYSQLLYLFSAQLLFISVWFVARIIFQLETKSILPSDNGGNFTEVIRDSYFGFVAVYFVGIGFVVGAALRLNSALTRLGIVSLALLTAIFLGLAFSVTAFCQTLQAFIGVQASAASDIVLVILLIFIVFIPLVLPNLLPREEDDLYG